MSDLFDPFAFAVGMLALVNPCGFALLPAYLGFFLGQEEDDSSRIIALNRAQVVGLSMSVGFLAVFGLLGIVFVGFQESIAGALPYFSVAMGIALVGLGIAMLRGFQPVIKIPKLEKGTGSRSAGSMFLFGVSYAIASLSCTIGLFITAVGTSSTAGTSFVDRLGGFVSYGLGMGLLATALTLAVAFGKRGLVNSFRSLLPKINKISGLILLIVGPYIALYGIWEIQVLDADRDITPWIDDVVGAVLDVQTGIANWINARSTVLGWSFFAINAALAIAGFVARRNDKRSQPAEPELV